MYLIFFGHFSRFSRTSPAFSAAIGSEELLNFIVVRISMLPAVDPMFSNSNSDFESSNKKEIAACLSSVLLLDSSFIVLEMALVFAMISCVSWKKYLNAR